MMDLPNRVSTWTNAGRCLTTSNIEAGDVAISIPPLLIEHLVASKNWVHDMSTSTNQSLHMQVLELATNRIVVAYPKPRNAA